MCFYELNGWLNKKWRSWNLTHFLAYVIQTVVSLTGVFQPLFIKSKSKFVNFRIAYLSKFYSTTSNWADTTSIYRLFTNDNFTRKYVMIIFFSSATHSSLVGTLLPIHAITENNHKVTRYVHFHLRKTNSQKSHIGYRVYDLTLAAILSM